MDRDGDLDAVFSNMEFNRCQIWLNDGHGSFTNSGQALTQQAHGVALGDLDGDGDLDLFVGIYGQASNEVWFNNTMTSINDEGSSFHEFPQEFQLFQNYPNPFNSNTTIRFHLSQPGKLKLHIFDTLGRLVHTLIDLQQPAGDYQISWDGTDKDGLQVSTGVYLCQFTIDERRLTNKLILIK